MSQSKPRPPQRQRSIPEICYDGYKDWLKTQPLLTKCITSAATASLGDAISQSSGKAAYQLRSTVAFAIFGFCITGPITHNFYRLLSKHIPADVKYGRFIKLLIDRLIFSPTFLMLFFYIIPLLQGKGLAVARERISESYWSALKANWKVWTLFQYVNLTYVPQQHQVLYANMVALFWNIYLSTKQR